MHWNKQNPSSSIAYAVLVPLVPAFQKELFNPSFVESLCISRNNRNTGTRRGWMCKGGAISLPRLWAWDRAFRETTGFTVQTSGQTDD